MRYKIEQLTAKERRLRRVRNKLKAQRKIRLCIDRSAKHIQAQIIDVNGAVLASAASFEPVIREQQIQGKVSKAQAVGKLIGERAKENNITECVFDRAGFHYHGRVKALAEGARAAGMVF